MKGAMTQLLRAYLDYVGEVDTRRALTVRTKNEFKSKDDQFVKNAFGWQMETKCV